ncbi:3-deoxy-7-phosphoheptulonate synthase [Streptomyces sp. NPDC050485]|uniref:3-deoxy-7-phosphoheptulonate synthase n=1 Tax=Streptomyces sp. NPDC050485 TaxID=3365617 RepID=UPI003792CD11
MISRSLAQRVVLQQPDWPDAEALAQAERELADLPALTTGDEIVDLARGMALVAQGSALVLQGGDCAERFEDAVPERVRQRADHLQGLAAGMRAGARLPTVAIGRMAGQYAKPRSSPFEKSAKGERLLTYRGDAVNDPAPDPWRRVADPRRLITAYECAALTLGGLRRSWSGRPLTERVFASHELLLMPYESPLVRAGVRGDYAGSTHFGWIGERTRNLGGAHLELARTVNNPIGVKIGPSMAPSEAAELSRLLNPEGIAGRLTFIVRAGAHEVDRVLPPVVEEVARSGTPVVWMCDPMHGNGQIRSGVKTRAVAEVLQEVTSFVRVLRSLRQWPAGLHLELTPDPVTECLPAHVDDMDFTDYRSSCDPRLNPEQSAEVISSFVALL